MLNETFNIVQKVYNTKTGKNPLLVYVDPKTSTDNTFDAKEKFKEYGMEYLPGKLGKYAPHAWGWILWNGENDRQMSMVKKFINDIPSIETNPEGSQQRGFDEITSNLEPVVREILTSINAAEQIPVKSTQDAETKRKIEEFKEKVSKGLDSEDTKDFLENLIKYRAELKKHNSYRLGWINVWLAWLARDGKASQIRPVKEWERMGYKPKTGIEPITLIGKGSKHIPYTKEEKAKIIQDYLDSKGVETIEELPQSSQYDLMNRKLRGRMVQGSEYQFGYQAYDIQDVEPIEGVEVEKEPEEPDNWWWNKLPENEKDIKLTSALIRFAESYECGNIKVNTQNNRYDLDGARGNATSSGVINLINDGKMRFPTAVHELTHQLRHFVFSSGNNPVLTRFYRHSNKDVCEQEAELCASFVVSQFGYDIRPHINYLSSWELNKENVTKVFDQIADVANFIENGVRKYLDNNNDN